MLERISTEEFSDWLGKFQDINLFYRQLTDKSAKQYLELRNMPSREDLSNLASLIVKLDCKVDNIEENLEEQLENQLDVSNANKEITLLKKDLKDLDKKLEEILQFIKIQNIETNDKVQTK